MAEALQSLAIPLAILLVGFFNYRLVSEGIKQMRTTSEAR